MMIMTPVIPQGAGYASALIMDSNILTGFSSQARIPAAFLPTSVIKKMHTEKQEGVISLLNFLRFECVTIP